jgi:hypothetical protein
MINFIDAGGKANDASAASANLTLLHNLLAATTVNNFGVVSSYGDAAGSSGTIYATGGPRIYFPPGVYHFSGPIRLRKAVHLMGSDGVTRATHNTIFVFPTNTQGLVADAFNTDNLNYAAPGNQQPSANGSVIEGIMFSGKGTSRNNAHGILIRCYVTMKNVGANGFGGHGIYIKADLKEGVGGQASNCLILGCSAESNWRSGLCVEVAKLDTGDGERAAHTERRLKPDAKRSVPDGVQYDRLTVLQHGLIKRQKEEIDTLKEQLADLTSRVAALEKETRKTK